MLLKKGRNRKILRQVIKSVRLITLVAVTLFLTNSNINNAGANFNLTSHPLFNNPIQRQKPTANISSDNPPFAYEVWKQSWGAGQGLAPQLWFWEDVPRYQELKTQINQVATKIEAQEQIPVAGLQLWQNTFTESQSDGKYSELPGHQAWVKWVEAHPEYLGVDRKGKIQGERFEWGYISPLVPLKPEDYPPDFEGDVAYFADWQADKLGRLAAFAGIQGFIFSDFFDSHPQTGPQNYFNSRIIDDFEKRTEITLSSKSLTEQAEEIRSRYYREWLDFWVDRWAYNWSALDREIRRHTGKEPWLVSQTSFTPAVMRRHGAIDPRIILQYMSPDNVIFSVQAIQNFMIRHIPLPESVESASIGLHAAREPEAHYDHNVMSSEERYWKAVDAIWSDLSPETRQELGWKRLKRTWLESGWTHVATRQGIMRRAAESWTRSYHNRGEIDESWVKLLREIDPTRPFGSAIYYSVAIERAYELHNGTRNPITTSYLGEELQPVTKLKEAGIPFNYYVSDAALDELQNDFYPSAWIIPDRYLKGKDLLSRRERRTLEQIAPILTEKQLKKFDLPLNFSSNQKGRTITGFGFYDQNDRLIVVASDRISLDETNNNLGATQAVISLKLPDGRYVARELLSGRETAFKVISGSGEFLTTIDRWDTQVFAITPVSSQSIP